MHSKWKILIGVLAYFAIFIIPLLQHPDGQASFSAIFAAVFLLIFFFGIFAGFFLFGELLSVMGIRILSSKGDIIKTDFGHKIPVWFLRALINLFADSLFNVVFILFAIAIFVAAALFAAEAARAFQQIV